MIPILFDVRETNFDHNGLGFLWETTKCNVTEILNGEFELLLEYPLTGSKYSLIEEQMFILAKPNKYDDPHLFRIYEHNVNIIDGIVEIHARSNTFDLADNMVIELSINEATPAQAMNSMKLAAVGPCDFEFYSDMTTTSSTRWTRQNLLSCISGTEGSILQYWGGELFRGNKELSIYKRRGADRDVTIRHGRNLVGLTAIYSTQGLVTAIIPYSNLGTNEATGNDEILFGEIVQSARAVDYPHTIFQAVDFPVDEYGEEVVEIDPEYGHETRTKVMTLEILNAHAQEWFSKNLDVDKPAINITAEIENLSQTEDYAHFKELEKLALGDTITVWSEKYNIELTARVIRVVYDCLADRLTEIEVGKIKDTSLQMYQRTIVNNYVKPVATQAAYAQIAANQKNRIFRGTIEPSEGMKLNDLWYKPVGEGETELYRFNGLVWVLEKVSGGLLQGTLDAGSGDLNIINLNADNITSGTINATMITISNSPYSNLEEVLENIESSPGPPGEAAYSVIIESSNGYIFKNGQISTILSARVFRGDLEITDDISAVQFRWIRISNDTVGDQIWNDKYFGGTKNIIITDEDVFQRATFKCEIYSLNGG